MTSLPASPCINCKAEQLKITWAEKRHEEGSDPPLWMATTYHVECGNCGHRFQVALIPEA